MLTVVYPFLKRLTSLPQVGLGLAFSCSILIAFAAQLNSLPAHAWLLFFANLCWTVAYDTQYAMADKHEDQQLKLKSTAILFGKHAHLAIALLQASFLMSLLILAVWCNFRWTFLGGWLLAVAAAYYQHRTMATQDQLDYLRSFNQNYWLGAAIFLGLLVAF